MLLPDQLTATLPVLVAGTEMLAGVAGGSSTVVLPTELHPPQPPALQAYT